MNDKEKFLFPSTTDYLEAVANPTGRFATLAGIAAVTDRSGEPDYTVGTGRVTFRVVREGRPVELTCFTTAAGYAGAGRYGELLEDEIYVFRQDGTGTYYPVAWRPVSDPADCPVACDELTEGRLCEGRRLVGIISHVAGLKERIDRQIVVKKDRSGGSRAEVVC